MRVVFDTKTLAAAQRREAWREAICEIYLQVDCVAEKARRLCRICARGPVRRGDAYGHTVLAAMDSPAGASHRALRQGLLLLRNRTSRRDQYSSGRIVVSAPSGKVAVYIMPTSRIVCVATSNHVSSGSNFLAKPLTAGSTPGDRRSSLPSDLTEVWAASPPSSAPPSRRRAPTSMRPPASSSASSSWTFWRWRCTVNLADNRRTKRAYSSRVWARSRPTSNRIWATRIYRWRR